MNEIFTPGGRARAAFVATAAAALAAGCGGSVVDDPGGTNAAVRLNCLGQACIASDTLPTSRITAMLYVVDDGNRTQAQAGFNTDGSITHNVELEGDELDFVDGSRRTRMALSLAGAFDFFGDLLTLGQPYLADVSPQPAAARDYAFELVRADGTLRSTVTLPAPFDIAAPSANARYPITTGTVPVTLTAPEPRNDLFATYTCVDSNGNQSTTSATATGGGAFSATDATGLHYAFSVPAMLATISFAGGSAPPGTVRSCNVTIHVVDTMPGLLAPGFHPFSIIEATQTRQVQITLD
ncbi:MAG TPA: hypothetical protein VF453_18435 [Burkholderiaceae bacterium]